MSASSAVSRATGSVTTPSYGADRRGLGRLRCRRSGRDRDHDAVAMERELDLFARFVDPPLHRGERDLERLGDLRVREADDVTQEESHLEVRVQGLDRTPDRIDRLGALGGRVDDLERRRVLDVHDRTWPPLERTELVEHAVLRHLEQPRREPGAEREARQTLEHAEEDLLGQILGETAITGQSQDVVVDRLLVRPDDDRKCPLVAALGLAQNTEIWLWQRHVRGEYRPRFVKGFLGGSYRRVASRFPVMSTGIATSSIPKMVGARSDSSPCSRSANASLVSTSGTRFVVCAVCGLTPSGSSMCSAFPWSAVTRQTPSSARTHSTTRPSAASAASTAAMTAGIEPVCPTMSGFAKLTTANA